jgi:hypothetical protein
MRVKARTPGLQRFHFRPSTGTSDQPCHRQAQDAVPRHPFLHEGSDSSPRLERPPAKLPEYIPYVLPRRILLSHDYTVARVGGNC